MLFISVVHTSQMKGAAKEAGGNLIHLKYWEVTTGYLKLSILNELVQMFRTSSKVLDPILRTMFIMGKHLEREEAADEALGRDLTCTLLKIVQKTHVVES